MRVIHTEKAKFIELQAKAAGTPYRDLLTFMERYADALEEEFAFDLYNDILHELELKTDQVLSIGDVGEVMVLLGTYWVYGERLLEHLSHIEQKIVAENVGYRLAVLAENARSTQ